MIGNRILVLSPHTDDAELGCGGSIAKWITEGKDVYIFAFSTGNPETGATKAEFAAAARVLGTGRIRLFDYPCRDFPLYRQKILDILVNTRDALQPDLVVGPASWDCHQDHQVVHQEMVRAFRGASILGYDIPRSAVELPVRLSLFVPLTEQNLTAKLAAIACYRSQVDRPSLSQSMISALARVRGTMCEHRFAEAFEVIRWIE